MKDWRFSGRLRHYGYDNDTGAVPIIDFINYDTSVTDSSTGGPRQHAHSRTSFEGGCDLDRPSARRARRRLFAQPRNV